MTLAPPKCPPPKTITLDITILKYEFVGDTNIQTIVNVHEHNAPTPNI